MSDDLRVEVDGGIATITLNRPEKRNAVTYDMWNGIASACDALGADHTVRMLVVRGEGDHFCAGADIGGLVEVEAKDYQAANEAADRALAAFPKPSIAVITGSCIGGGAEIAVACDIRLADTSARFGVTPARLGIVYPAIATERLVRAIGPSASKHLLFSAELIDAERALRIGLIDELHPVDEVQTRATELIDLIANQRSLLTQMASKEIVDAAARGDLDPGLGERWAAEAASATDRIEGVTAFLERRPPTFTWVPKPRD